MAGLYIHVPFCKTICHYCDFYRITDKKYYADYVMALVNEIESQAGFILENTIETLYFGGGTPSQMLPKDLDIILQSLRKYGVARDLIEFTFEMNPDDVTSEYLIALKGLGVNRISLGIQSLDDTILRYLHRRHNAQSALKAIELIQSFECFEISIDFIYGIPDLDIGIWEETLHRALSLGVNHISAYHLTIENDTVFGKMYEQGLLKVVAEDESVLQFDTLMKLCKVSGYEQYEISNFAKNGKYAQHNSSYWNNTEYIGFGPGAHSYIANNRFWNLSDIHKYIANGKSGQFVRESEDLTDLDRYHEYIITNLRTKWGISLNLMLERWPQYQKNFLNALEKGFAGNSLFQQNDRISLTQSGILISDHIFKEFFVA